MAHVGKTENMSTSIYPPDDRFCDLVMKGGITSGAVYPKGNRIIGEGGPRGTDDL